MGRQYVLPLALLFIALGVPSNAQGAGVTVDAGAPLTVECSLRVEERAEWRLDGGPVPADMRPAGESAAGARLTARLHVPAARAQHAGTYTCAREPAQRVVVRVRPLPGEVPAAEGVRGAQEALAARRVVLYDVGRAFTLNCSLTPAPGAALVWKKNDSAVDTWADVNGRYSLDKDGAVFKMNSRTNEEDFGNYTCESGGSVEGWEVRGRAHAKMAHNTNVVEKQKLKLICKVTGKPYPAVVWTYKNGTDNGTEVSAALGGRAIISTSTGQNVEGAQLVLEVAERSDAGEYTCAPEGGVAATTTLRVKDQYAALWPFLGICAEVFVLCAIILVYEKRRTKPELDDSDTDNHDQKKS